MISYKVGDLLKDCSATFLLHQTNCMGIMGGGIAAQIRKQNPKVYEEYSWLCCKQTTVGDLLGTIQILPKDNYDTNNPQYIVNCFGQNHISKSSKMTSYDALDECFMAVRDYCNKKYFDGCTIGIPYKIGCGLGGGDWEIVEAIISKNFPSDSKIDVEIWMLPGEVEVPFHD